MRNFIDIVSKKNILSEGLFGGDPLKTALKSVMTYWKTTEPLFRMGVLRSGELILVKVAIDAQTAKFEMVSAKDDPQTLKQVQTKCFAFEYSNQSLANIGAWDKASKDEQKIAAGMVKIMKNIMKETQNSQNLDQFVQSLQHADLGQ